MKDARRPLVAISLGAALVAVTGCGAGSAGLDAQSSFERYRYTNDAGTRTYKVFVPSTYADEPLPLIVELHGCSSNADEEARW